jgi:hypothetical protein
MTPKQKLQSGWNTIYGFIFLSLLVGCTVSKTATSSDKILVDQESPIFDHRFKTVSLKDINLEKFWESGDSSDDRAPVPLDNHTFSRITRNVKQAVVNIYTIRIEERDAKFGISPNDLLPIFWILFPFRFLYLLKQNGSVWVRDFSSTGKATSSPMLM